MAMNNPITLVDDQTLSLNKEFLNQLQSYEDCVGLYTQLDEANNATSWYKADLLLYMFEKFGHTSITKFTEELKLPYGTAINYIRTVKAFPPGTRIQNLSFTHHIKAALADKYDEKTGQFLGEERFGWIEKAADNKVSTRKLESQILREKREKKAKEEGHKQIQCTHCKSSDKPTKQYSLYCADGKRHSVPLDLDDDCYSKILDFIHGN